jgi:hypothetical protein
MRWLRMLLLGLMVGPAPLATDNTDAAEPGRGHAIRGANFYVWDEDAREATAWAAELAGATGERADAGPVLRALGALERTWLISSWAMSPDEPTRRMLARALGEPLDAVGARWVVEHLQRDPSPEVRRLAGAAAARSALSGTDRA